MAATTKLDLDFDEDDDDVNPMPHTTDESENDDEEAPPTPRLGLRGRDERRPTLNRVRQLRGASSISGREGISNIGGSTARTTAGRSSECTLLDAATNFPSATTLRVWKVDEGRYFLVGDIDIECKMEGFIKKFIASMPDENENVIFKARPLDSNSKELGAEFDVPISGKHVDLLKLKNPPPKRMIQTRSEDGTIVHHEYRSEQQSADKGSSHQLDKILELATKTMQGSTDSLSAERNIARLAIEKSAEEKVNLSRQILDYQGKLVDRQLESDKQRADAALALERERSQHYADSMTAFYLNGQKQMSEDSRRRIEEADRERKEAEERHNRRIKEDEERAKIMLEKERNDNRMRLDEEAQRRKFQTDDEINKRKMEREEYDRKLKEERDERDRRIKEERDERDKKERAIKDEYEFKLKLEEKRLADAKDERDRQYRAEKDERERRERLEKDERDRKDKLEKDDRDRRDKIDRDERDARAAELKRKEEREKMEYDARIKKESDEREELKQRLKLEHEERMKKIDLEAQQKREHDARMLELEKERFKMVKTEGNSIEDTIKKGTMYAKMLGIDAPAIFQKLVNPEPGVSTDWGSVINTVIKSGADLAKEAVKAGKKDPPPAPNIQYVVPQGYTGKLPQIGMNDDDDDDDIEEDDEYEIEAVQPKPQAKPAAKKEEKKVKKESNIEREANKNTTVKQNKEEVQIAKKEDKKQEEPVKQEQKDESGQEKEYDIGLLLKTQKAARLGLRGMVQQLKRVPNRKVWKDVIMQSAIAEPAIAHYVGKLGLRAAGREAGASDEMITEIMNGIRESGITIEGFDE